MRLLRAILLTLAVSWIASGQTYTISTFAGGALPVNITGISAGLGQVSGVAVDSAGNVFMADIDLNVVFRLAAGTGILTVVAGNGTPGFSGDNGPAIGAQLYYPQGVAVDSVGTLYIADGQNNRIRKVSNGVISTIVGGGSSLGDNGPATSAQLFGPIGVAVDPAGSLYIADQANSRIRKVSNGVITTIAGNGTLGFSGDNGPATSAQLDFPSGVTVDSAGNLYIADQGNSRIRKVSDGVITTIAGNGAFGFSGDNGPATSAQLDFPYGVTVDSAGNLYIADAGTNRIRKVSSGVITTVAGNGGDGFNGDNGPATSAQLSGPQWVAVDSAANLYISSNRRIRKVSNGVITTIAGNGSLSFGGDNGPALSAELFSPWAVGTDSAGNVYISTHIDSRIRKVSSGVITTVAGNGTDGFSGDNGLAIIASLGDPLGVAADSTGNLYIAEYMNSRVRKVLNGMITTIAGTGTPGPSGDNGPPATAQLNQPVGVAVDSAGALYIADWGNNRIRKVSNGVITTVAGNGTYGSGGDNGAATSAQLRGPQGVAVDSAGNVYIADTQNNRVRKVSNGVITTIAGNGMPGSGGDNGPATSAQLTPSGVAVDSAGNLYIADEGDGNIRKISNGVITTIAGTGTPGFSGDGGPATSAQLAGPTGIAIDSAGRLYVADSGNNRIRLLTPATSSCTYSISPTSLQAPATGGNLTITIQTAASCSWTTSGLPTWITVSGASSGAGPATITVVVAPNTGASLSATISIAGVSVAVTQSAASGCTYAISPGGQTFAAAGGSGTINITAGAGCAWTAASSATWVTITGVGTGSGNGAITYQAAANTGTARSGVVTIASLSFTVEEGSTSIAGFTNAGSMPQLASAGYWTTTITLVNTGSSAASARLNFFDSNGNPLALPLTFPQSAATAGPLLAATLDRTLNPGAELVIVTTGPSAQTTQVGWAQLLTNGTIGGFAVFSDSINGDQEAVVPIETRNASTYILSFDNTNGADTGTALANLGTQALNAAVTINDDTGALILSDTIALPAMGHSSIDMATRYASSTAGRRGTIQFTSPSPGQICVIGLRFTPAGAFTTIPPLAK